MLLSTMAKILFISSVIRVGEKIYSGICCLKNMGNHSIDFLPNHEVVDHLYANDDKLSEIRKKCILIKEIKPKNMSKYDLIIFDDNIIKKRYGTFSLFSSALSSGTKIALGCHGNTDFSKFSYHNSENCFHYVFGKKDVDIINKDRLFPVGIPGNDNIKYQSIENRYAIIVVGIYSNRTDKIGDIKCMSIDNIKSICKHINNFYGSIDILVKFKPRVARNKFLDPEITGKESDVTYLVEADNDCLIAGASVIVSPGSTLLFKAMQLRKKTLILDQFGQLGSFFDYPYICKTIDDIPYSLSELEKGKVSDEWINRTIEGGLTFSSSESFAKITNDIIEYI